MHGATRTTARLTGARSTSRALENFISFTVYTSLHFLSSLPPLPLLPFPFSPRRFFKFFLAATASSVGPEKVDVQIRQEPCSVASSVTCICSLYLPFSLSLPLSLSDLERY